MVPRDKSLSLKRLEGLPKMCKQIIEGGIAGLDSKVPGLHVRICGLHVRICGLTKEHRAEYWFKCWMCLPFTVCGSSLARRRTAASAQQSREVAGDVRWAVQVVVCSALCRR